ncbi:MAG: hemolysin family protein [Candidatus Delongbacteria bacterium]|nr:hemolysin family protein [Candidatus Delongbacteria bacterium]
MLIFLITAAFLFSAFFSMSEIVYTVADRIKIRVWAKAGSAPALKAKKLIKNPDSFLIPILVGNNIANVAYATFFAYLAASMNWRSSGIQITFYETIILVIFAEMIPKVLGKKFSDRIALKIIYPFIFIKTLLAPVTYLVGRMSVRIMKMIKMQSGKSGWVMISKGDIDFIVNQAVKSETVKKKDARIIRKVLNLEQMKVREIMLHRRSIIAVDINSPVYKLRKMVILTSFSKIIVYENDLDNITGVAFARDLLKEGVKEVKDIVRPALFIPENTSILSLFKMLKKEKSSIGVIIDEFGGCLGIVTMHDILELIVGKVDDSHESTEPGRGIIYRPEIRTLIIAGTADPEELYRMIGSITGKDMRKPKYRNETVNGYVINSIKRIPEQGETVVLDGLDFRIMKAKKNFIETLIIKLPK